MAKCENIDRCPYFNDAVSGKNALSFADKQKFCKDDNAGCARYMVFKRFGGMNVPKDLAPYELNRARQVVYKLSLEHESNQFVCDKFETCKMFSEYLSQTSSLVSSFQQKFCRVNNTECARYILLEKVGSKEIPIDLFPNERSRALSILKEFQYLEGRTSPA